MAENGWTQGICQEEPSFPRLLINSLGRLGVTERPRYYSREYEHLGTLRCRVVLSSPEAPVTLISSCGK
jgi:hypothetical protein